MPWVLKETPVTSQIFYGYEMKTGGSKTSFGDWGPDYFIYRDEKKFPNLVEKTGKEKQKLQNKNKDEVFLKVFGDVEKF